MTRKFKTLGLALFAVFAMGSLAASAQASPEPLTVTPEVYPAGLTTDALNIQRFNTAAGTEVTCSNLDGHATIEEPGAPEPVGDTEVTFTDIRYSNCDTSTGQKVTVDMEGCHYTFHGGVEDEPDHFIEGTVNLECPDPITGPKITIWASAAKHTSEPTKPLCTLTVWEFTNGGEITYENTPASGGHPNDFDLKAVNVNTNYTRTGSILCGTTPNTAVYNGEVTVTGFEDLGVSGDTIIEGDPIGVTVSEGV